MIGWLIAKRLNLNNLVFFCFFFFPLLRSITQEANFLVTENTGQYFTTERNNQKGK